MSFYIVPEIFDEQKKVILYGSGLEAMGMIEQCHSLGINNIIAVIDDSENTSNLYHIPLHHTSWLKMQEGSSYDYIVITSNITRSQDGIVYELIHKYKVPENKILFGNYQIILESGGILGLSDVDSFLEGISRFSKSEANIGNEIEYIVKKIKEGNQQALVQGLKERFQTSSSFKEQIVCATILMKSNLFTAENMELFFSYIKNADITKYASWKHKLVFDIIPVYMMRHPSNLYEAIWSDKEEILNQIGAFYYGKPIAFPHKKKKIVLCGSLLRGKKQHMTNIIISTANEFARIGYEVLIVVEDNLYRANEYFIKHTFGSGTDSKKWDPEMQPMLQQGVQLAYVPGTGLKNRLNNTIKLISGFCPELVYHYVNDSTSVSYALHKLVPIVFPETGMEGHNSYYHALAVSKRKLTLMYNQMHHCFKDERRIVEYDVFRDKKDPKNIYPKEKYGLENSFTIITVGNRLEFEIDKTIVDEMAWLLEQYPRMKWLLTGTVELEYISTNYAQLVQNKQIAFLEYEDDLPALYQICDVYLNPDRMGGGISVIWAMQQALPIAQILRVSFGTAWTGIENAIDGDMHDVMLYIESLYQDASFYEKESKKFKEAADRKSMKKCVEGLIAAGETAKEIFAEDMQHYKTENELLEEQNNDTI